MNNGRLAAAVLSVLAALLIISCGKQPEPQAETPALSIYPLITRATEVHFEDGDRIGVSITFADGSSYVENAPLTYADGVFSGELKWYEHSAESSSLKACYPYDGTGFPQSFEVGADQRDGAGAYDLMMAAKEQVRPQEAAVTMAFRHQLSQIVVNVKNEAGISIDEITLRGLLYRCVLSDDGTEYLPDASAGTRDFIMEQTVRGEKFRAIVVPQTMAFTVGVRTASGAAVVKDFTEITMKPGYTYRIEAEVLADGVRFSLSGEIDAWEDGGTIGSLDIPLMHSRSGSIIIKEIYCGGCKRLPQEGNYASDQYVILHNNDYRTQYLDGLCIGSLHPYNAMGTNPFISKDPVSGEVVYPDYVPISEAVWMFGGEGEDFPLEPGEDAVVCLKGAIDHTRQFPLSVDLNVPGYFVCYNNSYFTNTTYHPAPGANIAQDHYLEVVVKTSRATAYSISISSPAMVLYRAEGMSMREFVQTSGALIPIPGSGSASPYVTAIPLDWVVDAVEVFSGTSSSNAKRLPPSLDAGYVTLSDTYLGHTLFRRTDETASAAAGYEVLSDSNNSSTDFYERETQSLHK